MSDAKRLEQELGTSEERLRALLDSVHDYAVFTLDPEGLVTSWNEGARRVKGYTAEEIIGQPVSVFYTPEDRRKPSREMAEALRTGRSEDESWRVHKDGTHLWINEVMTPLRTPDGALLGFTKVSRDLSHRKRSEELMRRSEERLRLVIESVTDYAIFTLDPEGRIGSWNSGAEALFGYSETEALGRSGNIVFTPEDQQAGAHAAEMQTARERGRAPDERWLVRKNGTRFYASGVLAPLRGSGRLSGYVKVARDLTERKVLERELRRAHDHLEARVTQRTQELATANESLREEIAHRQVAEQMRNKLLLQLTNAEEEERRRISRELHDQVGQQAVLLLLKLDMLKSARPPSPEQIKEIKEIATQLDAEIDSLVWQLRPTALDDLGLTDTLAEYVKEWSEYSGVAVKLQSATFDASRLSPHSASALYRITQEALTNVRRHARAANVEIVLEAPDGEVLLTIRDDGIGFDAALTAAENGPRVGLRGMHERATLLGGSVTIESRPGSGTTVLTRIAAEQ